MEPRPSTSSSGNSSKAGARDGGPAHVTDGVDDAVPSTSGSGSVPVEQQQQQEEQIFFFGFRASVKQCQQLFGATCRVKLQRCRLTTIPVPAEDINGNETPAEDPPAVPKVEEDSDSDTDTTGSSSSSDEDDIKVFASPRAAAPPLARDQAVTIATLPATSSGAPANSRTGSKVKEETESGRSSSSSSEDDPEEERDLPSAVQSTSKRPVAKKRRGKSAAQPKPSIKCPVCKIPLRSKDTLKAHMPKHTRKNGYKCEHCGRSFWSCSTFANHKKARSQRNGVCPRKRELTGGWRPKGPWNCKICRKRIKSAGSYLSHMRIHLGDKRFKCGECGKAFVQKIELSKHARIHSGVWQYSCVFCDKGFHHKTDMFRHLWGHTKEKSYFCKVNGCGKTFRFPKSLNYHRRNAH